MNAVQFLVLVGSSLESISLESGYSMTSIKNWNKGQEMSSRAVSKFDTILQFYLFPSCKELEAENKRFSVVYRHHTFDDACSLAGSKLGDFGNIITKQISEHLQRLESLTVTQLANFIVNVDERDRAFIQTIN